MRTKRINERTGAPGLLWACAPIFLLSALGPPAALWIYGGNGNAIDAWGAGGSLLGGCATAIAVFAALWAYGQERNRHKASVLLEAFSKFYDNDDKRNIRASLENFGEPTLRSVARKAIDCPEEMTRDEAGLCDTLDDYLNFFQFIGWLRDNKDLDDESVEAMFRFYLASLLHERNMWLLDYMQHFGFSPLATFLRNWNPESQTPPPSDERTEIVFAYGSLRKGTGGNEGRKILNDRPPKGQGTIHGRLYLVKDQDYPALRDSWNVKHVVYGEFYHVTESELAELDRYEGFTKSPSDDFVRRRRRINVEGKPGIDAWVYVWNGRSDELVPMRTGDWVEYRKTLQTSPRPSPT